MKIRIRLAELARKKSFAEGRTINKHVISVETGVSYSTVVSYWENSVKQVNFDVLVKLCTYFGCYLEDLIALDAEPSDVDNLQSGEGEVSHPELVAV